MTRTLVSGNERRQERPDAEWIRGECPVCGEVVVSNVYYATLADGSRGYIILWQCWGSLAEEPTCDYQRVL